VKNKKSPTGVGLKKKKLSVKNSTGFNYDRPFQPWLKFSGVKPCGPFVFNQKLINTEISIPTTIVVTKTNTCLHRSAILEFETVLVYAMLLLSVMKQMSASCGVRSTESLIKPYIGSIT
jgi:hypothetical protein